MTERPILFSAPMVRAILDGSKTQTRRVMKRQPHEDWHPAHYTELHAFDKDGELNPDKVVGWGAVNEDGDQGYVCPYGQPGDRLWVREAFAFTDTHCPEFEGSVDYRADGKCLAVQSQELHNVPSMLDPWKGPWKPSIHMPRWASRILLEIVSVRVERLNDISEGDAVAEGIGIATDHMKAKAAYGMYFCRMPDGKIHYGDSAVSLFQKLWEQINGAGSWDANPWVWVVEFRRLAGESGEYGDD